MNLMFVRQHLFFFYIFWRLSLFLCVKGSHTLYLLWANILHHVEVFALNKYFSLVAISCIMWNMYSTQRFLYLSIPLENIFAILLLFREVIAKNIFSHTTFVCHTIFLAWLETNSARQTDGKKPLIGARATALPKKYLFSCLKENPL